MERCWPLMRVSKRRRNETKRAHMSTTHSNHQHCCRVENCLVAPFRQRSGLKSKIGRSANMRATGRGDSFHPVSTKRRRCLVQDHENARSTQAPDNPVLSLEPTPSATPHVKISSRRSAKCSKEKSRSTLSRPALPNASQAAGFDVNVSKIFSIPAANSLARSWLSPLQRMPVT